MDRYKSAHTEDASGPYPGHLGRKTLEAYKNALATIQEENRQATERIAELERLLDNARELASGPLRASIQELIKEKRAAERENREKCLELAEMAGSRDGAARELLFLAGVEGIGSLSRGGKGCIFRALEHLRPDIATLWAEEEDPFALLHRFFPEE